MACSKRRENEPVAKVGKHVACSKRRENVKSVAEAGELVTCVKSGENCAWQITFGLSIGFDWR